MELSQETRAPGPKTLPSWACKQLRGQQKEGLGEAECSSGGRGSFLDQSLGEEGASSGLSHCQASVELLPGTHSPRPLPSLPSVCGSQLKPRLQHLKAPRIAVAITQDSHISGLASHMLPGERRGKGVRSHLVRGCRMAGTVGGHLDVIMEVSFARCKHLKVHAHPYTAH